MSSIDYRISHGDVGHMDINLDLMTVVTTISGEAHVDLYCNFSEWPPWALRKLKAKIDECLEIMSQIEEEDMQA